MALIPLFEAKTYLRVDSGDEDALIGILLSSAEQMCKDVGRLSDDQWEAVNAADASFDSVRCEGGGVLMIDKLNERITIQQSKHMTDKVGNHRNAWVDYYTCFAYASTFEAQEDEGEVTAEQKSVVFTVRWCSEVNKLTSTGFRILFRGELYDITSVDPMNYDKKTIKLHCRLERRQK